MERRHRTDHPRRDEAEGRIDRRLPSWTRILAAEETFYPIGSVSPLRIDSRAWAVARELRGVFTDRGLRPRVATDSPGTVGYVSDLAMVDVRGVITRSIARQPLPARGRPGHERWASTAELIAELIAEGAVISTFNPFGPLGEPSSASVDGAGFHFLRFDEALVEQLAGLPGARLPDPEGNVDAILAAGDPALVEAAIRFYSDFLAGSGLRGRVLARLEGGCID